MNDGKVLTVTLCWLAVYFSPNDLVFRLLTRLKLPVTMLNGWKRSRDIGAGYLEAKRFAPGSIVVQVVLCILSGTNYRLEALSFWLLIISLLCRLGWFSVISIRRSSTGESTS
jgi:hypothetical protein